MTAKRRRFERVPMKHYLIMANAGTPNASIVAVVECVDHGGPVARTEVPLAGRRQEPALEGPDGVDGQRFFQMRGAILEELLEAVGTLVGEYVAVGVEVFQ